MNCSKCNSKTVVFDGAYVPDTNERYRKRRCTKCDHVFFTVEFEVDDTDDVKETWHKNRR